MKKILILCAFIFGCSVDNTTTPDFTPDYQYLDTEYISSSSFEEPNPTITLIGTCNLIASDILRITDLDFNQEDFCETYKNSMDKKGLNPNDLEFCLKYRKCE